MIPAAGRRPAVRGRLHVRLKEILGMRERNQIPAGRPAEMFQELGEEIFLRDDHPDVTVRVRAVALPRAERDIVHGKKAEHDHAPTSRVAIYIHCFREVRYRGRPARPEKGIYGPRG